MNLFLMIFLALGFFIFSFLAMLIVADSENNGLMQRSIISGLLSSILFFVIIDVYTLL